VFPLCMYVCMTFLWLVGIDARLAVCALLFLVFLRSLCVMFACVDSVLFACFSDCGCVWSACSVWCACVVCERVRQWEEALLHF